MLKKIKNIMEYPLMSGPGITHIRPEILICLLLVLITFLVYRQVGDFDFISFDDKEDIIENIHVKRGLTMDGIRWAFRIQKSGYWHPLAWISHMLDCELYGLNPGMHHRNNVLIHMANVLLLFAIFRVSTNETGKSALTAAVFAIHPINVESVAWVAERKNVLSTFFWFLTTVTYVYYVRKPSAVRYLTCIVLFTAGLLSKPMLITLLFALLLLDYWPLRRFDARQMLFSVSYRIILEKIPFFVLSAMSVYITALSLARSNIVISTETVPMGLRIASLPVLYAQYLCKIFLPVNLAVFYPYPRGIILWQVTASLIFLAGISLFALKNIKKYPYLAVGWLWFLGTLFTVMGLKQAGVWPAIADRSVYVPAVGIYTAFAWGMYDLSEKRYIPNKGIAAAFAIIISVLMGITFQYLPYWKDSITLYRRALSVTHDNDIMHYSLANELMNDPAKKEEVIYHYSEALRINPRYLQTRNNLGIYMLQLGEDREAVKHFLQVLEMDPDNINAHNNLGVTLARYGKTADAARHFREIIGIDPENAEAHNNLGTVMAEQGNLSEALRYFQKALELDPDFEKAKNNIRKSLEDIKQKKTN